MKQEKAPNRFSANYIWHSQRTTCTVHFPSIQKLLYWSMNEVFGECLISDNDFRVTLINYYAIIIIKSCMDEKPW